MEGKRRIKGAVLTLDSRPQKRRPERTMAGEENYFKGPGKKVMGERTRMRGKRSILHERRNPLVHCGRDVTKKNPKVP